MLYMVTLSSGRGTTERASLKCALGRRLVLCRAARVKLAVSGVCDHTSPCVPPDFPVTSEQGTAETGNVCTFVAVNYNLC